MASPPPQELRVREGSCPRTRAEEASLVVTWGASESSPDPRCPAHEGARWPLGLGETPVPSGDRLAHQRADLPHAPVPVGEAGARRHQVQG